MFQVVLSNKDHMEYGVVHLPGLCCSMGKRVDGR